MFIWIVMRKRVGGLDTVWRIPWQWAAYLMEIIVGHLSRAVLEGDWTRRTVWKQIGPRADSHYASRFLSVTVPSSFRQNDLFSHCLSWSVTFQNSTW